MKKVKNSYRCKVWPNINKDNKRVYSWRIALPKEIIRELKPDLINFRWAYKDRDGQIHRYYENYLFGLEIYRAKYQSNVQPLSKFGGAYGFAINSTMAKAITFTRAEQTIRLHEDNTRVSSLHDYFLENTETLGRKLRSRKNALIVADLVELEQDNNDYDNRAILFRLPDNVHK